MYLFHVLNHAYIYHNVYIFSYMCILKIYVNPTPPHTHTHSYIVLINKYILQMNMFHIITTSICRSKETVFVPVLSKRSLV